MDDAFVTLAALVRGATLAPPAPQPVAASAVTPEFAHASVVHELALLRLAAIEAFENRTLQLLRALADLVLVRELETSPADLLALARRVLATYGEHEPVEIVVAPSDAGRVRGSLPVRIDPTLVAGDLVVNVRDGAFESFFRFRLDAAFARAAEWSEA